MNKKKDNKLLVARFLQERSNLIHENLRLKLRIEALEKKLTLTDVVPMLLCIDDTETSHITKGKKYAILFEGTEMYTITNDIGERDIYAIDRFTKVNNN